MKIVLSAFWLIAFSGTLIFRDNLVSLGLIHRIIFFIVLSFLTSWFVIDTVVFSDRYDELQEQLKEKLEWHQVNG